MYSVCVCGLTVLAGAAGAVVSAVVSVAGKRLRDCEAPHSPDQWTDHWHLGW